MDELCGGRHIRLLPPARWGTPTIVLLEPDAAQHLDRRGVSDFGRSLGGIRGLQQGKAIGPNGRGQLLPIRVGFREPVVLYPVAVAVTPCWLYMGTQPRRGSNGKAIQRVAHRFPDQLLPV